MKLHYLWISTLLIGPTLSAALPQKLEVQGGAVEALVIGKPSLLKIKAKGEPPTGSLILDGAKVSGTFEFALGTLDSGIELRDDHMKNKYLKVSEHPKAKLVIHEILLDKAFSIADPAVTEADFKGDLTLHGVTKPIQGKFNVNDERAVVADFKIKLTDFAIGIPSYMGITVADEVNVRVQIEKLKPAVQ